MHDSDELGTCADSLTRRVSRVEELVEGLSRHFDQRKQQLDEDIDTLDRKIKQLAPLIAQGCAQNAASLSKTVIEQCSSKLFEELQPRLDSIEERLSTDSIVPSPWPAAPRKPCKFFAQNRCSKGGSCPFSHATEQPDGDDDWHSDL